MFNMPILIKTLKKEKMENSVRIQELKNAGFFIPETIEDVGKPHDSVELRTDMLKTRRERLPRYNPGDCVIKRNRKWKIIKLSQTPSGPFKYRYMAIEKPEHKRESYCYHFDIGSEKYG